MRSYLKYLLLTSAIAGCTIETTDKSGSGGTGSTTGGSKATGGASTGAGGTTAITTGGATSSSVGGVTGTSTGGSGVAGGSSSVGGSTAIGGSTAVPATTGGATAAGGSTAVSSSSTSLVGGATATGGTGTNGTVVTTGGAGAAGGTSAGSIGGTTAVGTEPDASANLPVIKLSLASCAVVTPTTWTKGIYDTTECGAVTVLNELTIEPGTIAKFGPDGYLDVVDTGSLKAIGTEAEPIIFTSIKDDAHGGDTGADGSTSATSGQWGTDGAFGGVDLNGTGSQLDHVEVLYAINGVGIHGASTKVANSTFAHNSGNGLLLDGGNTGSTTITGSAFFGNGGFPLSLGEFVSLDASNIFHDPADPSVKNTKQCIEIAASSVGAAVSLGVTELAFYGSFAIDSALTVSNGVCFKPDADGEIDLNASGSIVNGGNAIFTSAKDDSVGGDCTGDGATTPANADWAGIWVTTSATADWAAPTANIRYTDQVTNPGTMPLH